MKAKTIAAVAIGAMLASLAGCESAHRQNVKAAEARWARARAAVMLQLADQQFANGELDKALATLGKAGETDPQLAELHVMRGRVLAEKGRGQEAIEAFAAALAIDGRNAEANYHAGVQMERWAQFDKALSYYQEAARLAPAKTAYAVAAIEALAQLGRTAEALDLADKALNAHPQSVAVRVTAGEICMASADYERAIGYFRDAMRLATGDDGILRRLAMALHHARRYGEARGYLEQLVASMPPRTVQPGMFSAAVPPPDRKADDAFAWTPAGRAELLSALGDCLLASGSAADVEKARKVYAEVLTMFPHQAGAWENMAKAALQAEQWGEVLRCADQAAGLAPRSPTPHVLRGFALDRLGRQREAIAALETAHRLQPADVLMLCLISDNYRKLGDTKGAREALVRALQIAPTDKLASRMMSRLSAPRSAGS